MILNPSGWNLMAKDRLHQRELLNSLLEKASVQGYLTTDDLLEVEPDVTDTESFAVLLLGLRQQGIEVVDVDKAEPSADSMVEPWGLDIDNGDNDTVGMYLKEMSRVPLLNLREEQELAGTIAKGRSARIDLIQTTRGMAYS